MSYEGLGTTGVSGNFYITGIVYFLDDTNTHPVTANINPTVNFVTMTALQIQTAIINAIIELGASMGFTLAANNNQIIIPTMGKV